MERRTTALVIAGVALAMLAVGLVVNAVDDGGTAEAAAPSCVDTPPTVVVDVPGLVADGGNDLTLVRPDGSQSVLEGPADVVSDAEFTPDGGALVATVAVGDYESAGPEATTISVLGLDGGAPRALTVGAVLDDQPVVSPDATTVAFTRLGPDGRGILTVPFAGGEPTVVVAPSVPWAGVPEWSPAGDRIAYVRGGPQGEGPPSSEVRSVAPDGGDDRLLATLPGQVASLDWRPDGTQLLVGLGGGGQAPSVLTLDLASGATRPVAEAAGRARWSRGGTQVVLLVSDDTGPPYRLVERAVIGVDGADVSGGADRDLGVSVGNLYPYVDIAVAPCRA